MVKQVSVSTEDGQRASGLPEIRQRLRRLERQDSWLWAVAMLIMLLLVFGIFSLTFPGIWREQNPFYWVELDTAVRGLFGLVLLFGVFVIYQQTVIKRLRNQLAMQLAEMAALETRAETFERLAVVDPLTELYNRRFATEHLPIELARASRQRYPLTLLMLDLNGFKEINDHYGHAAGDTALAQFARHLKRCFRSSDLPVRMGGDEFMVLLPECPADQVPKVLTHLRGLSVEHGAAKIDITFAAGWAEYRRGESATDLPARADQALYADKHTRDADRQVRAAEAEMAQQQKMLTVGHMTGGVAHDFNNLLTIIRGYSELLLDSIPKGDAHRDKVEEIDRAAARAASLTSQLLSFSRKQPPHPERRMELNQLFRGMESMIRSLLGRRIALAFEPGVESAWTRGDSTQLEQLLLNLVVNARDAMPDGGTVTIRTGQVELAEDFVRHHPGARPGSYVSLAVSDTGVGMDEQTKLHIFEPFFTTKPNGQGTGLGLAIVYGVVKQTGSYIEVESEIGRGSRFTVYFPRLADETLPVQNPQRSAAAPRL
jgi:diguanylate cyclase (GGDEF)-like protein